MLSMWVRRGVCVGLGLVSVVTASAASARGPAESEEEVSPRGSGHEALQLTLQGSLVNYVKQTVKLKDLEGSDSPDLKTSTTTFGVLGPALGVGVGYAWDQVLLGVRANLAKTDTSFPDGQDASVTQISIAPRLEYMFNQGSARPFIAGLLAIEHSSATASSSSQVESGSPSSQSEDSSTLFAIGAAFGVHGFLNRSVSLDPELTVLYAAGSGSVGSVTNGAPNPQAQDYSVSAVRVLFSLGLSGWIDTAGEPTPPPPSPSFEAPPPPAAPAPR